MLQLFQTAIKTNMKGRDKRISSVKEEKQQTNSGETVSYLQQSIMPTRNAFFLPLIFLIFCLLLVMRNESKLAPCMEKCTEPSIS